MSENLWGAIDAPENIQTPLSILRQQAKTLSELTKGVVVGRVDNDTDGGELHFHLSVVAPALNDYRYSVLRVDQPITIYPLVIKKPGGYPVLANCSTEAEFKDALGKIFQSPEIKKVISSLLIQSRR